MEQKAFPFGNVSKNGYISEMTTVCPTDMPVMGSQLILGVPAGDWVLIGGS